MKLLGLLTCLMISLFAYNQSFFKKFGGGLQVDEGKAIVECANSEIVVGGVTTYGSGGTDIFLSRFTSGGQLLWSKTFGLSGDESGGPFGLYEANNGDLLCSFRSESLGQTRAAVFMRLDQNGNIIWQKQMTTGSTSEWTRTIFEHADGSIYVGASVNNQMFGSSDAVLTKMDGNGNMIWSKTIGMSGNDHIWSMIPLPNNEILLNMNSQTLGPGTRSAVLVKIDANGNILNEVAYGGSGLELGSDVVYKPGIGYLVTGGTTSFGQGGRDAYIAFFDVNFNLQWFKSFGGTLFDHGVTSEIIDNNHFVMYMNSDLSGSGDKQLSIVGVDTTGATLYTKTIGGGSDDYLTNNSSSALVHSDNLSRTYLTGAYTESSFDVQAFLFAVDGSPESLCSDTIISETTNNATVTNVNFNQGNLGSVQNITLSTSTITPNLYDFCPCPLVPPNLDDTTLCAGTTVSYDLDTAYNYVWSPAADFSCSTCPDPDFIGSDTSLVKVLFDNETCVDSVSFSINVNASGIANAIGPDTICGNNPSIFLSSAVVGQWSGNGIIDPSAGEFDPTGLSGDVEIIFTADNPCIEKDTISVFVESAINANISSAIDTLCFDKTTDTLLNLTATPSAGYWSGIPIYDSVNGYLDENFINSGPQLIYYTPYGKCVNRDSIIIDMVEVDTASILFQDTLCEIDAAVDLNIQNGYDGTWVGGGIIDAYNGSFDPSQAVTGYNNIVFEPQNQCISNDTIGIFIEGVVSAEIELNDTVLCINNEALLLNASPLNGSWSGFVDSTVNEETYFSPAQNGVGSFDIYYVPNDECAVSDSIAVTVNDLNVSVQDSLTICQNLKGEVEYSPSGGVWTGHNQGEVINGTSIDPSLLSPGVYEYVYAVDNGCFDSDTLILTVLSTPDADLGEDTTICHDCEIQLSPAEVFEEDSVLWSTGSSDSNITVDTEGVYEVYIETSLGCRDSASILLRDTCEAALYIPNSFTPDDSGLNDVLKVYGEFIKIESFEIYNRWGNRIYSTNRAPVKWDGTNQSNNAKVKDGVYVYKISFYKCDQPNKSTKTGHIVVLK